MRLLYAIALVVLALLLVAFFVPPAWSGPRCLTYEEKTLGRLQTLCDDGTRAVSTWNRTLERWESTVTPPPTSDNNYPKLGPQPKAPRR